ncbi:DUF424 family protein [archaeon]|jgi:hypothetical protein|nr:DUF424 family protein [archaeon]
MYIKIHEAYRTIIAVADSNLIGKTFEQDIKQIEIKPTFFKGEEIETQELIKTLQDFEKEDATFNIVGKESIKCAIEAGIISKEGIMEIDGVPVGLGLF